MWRYCLSGKLCHRTPLAYPAYQSLLGAQGLDLGEAVTIEQGADILIFAHIYDIAASHDQITHAKKINPSIKIALFSEEPFWDSVWGGDFYKSIQKINIHGQNLDCHVINHVTSDVFDFDKIPYFITTQDSFAARYRLLFTRNLSLSKTEYAKTWRSYLYRMAFIAENRTDDFYDVSFPEHGVYGLCKFRSLLANEFNSNDCLIEGQGWGITPPRQSLADWHLDKITRLDRNCRIVSALENTHQQNYVSEKIFDAFACGAIPLYFANDKHRIFNIASKNSFINLFGHSIAEAKKAISAFEPTNTFINDYLDTQSAMADSFSAAKTLQQERILNCQKIHKKITSIL